jgi:hypothetical protein
LVFFENNRENRYEKKVEARSLVSFAAVPLETHARVKWWDDNHRCF